MPSSRRRRDKRKNNSFTARLKLNTYTPSTTFTRQSRAPANMQMWRQFHTDGATIAIGRHREKSQKDYKSDDKSWVEFNRQIGHSHDIYSIFEPGDKIVCYVVWRSQTPCARTGKPPCQKTIIRNVRGIKAAALNKFLPTRALPLTTEVENPRLWAVIKGLDDDVDQSKKAISQSTLHRMLQCWDKATIDGRIRRMTAAVSHNSIRRSAETLQRQRGGLKPRMIQWENGTHFPNSFGKARDRYASIHFNCSKTNKDRKPQTALLYCFCKKGPGIPCGLCELRELYRMQRHISEDQPLNTMSDGKTYHYQAYLDDTQEAYARVTGNDPKEVGTHSHRSGGFQAAMKEGIDPKFILQQGYWKNMDGTAPYRDKMKTHRDIDLDKLKLLKM